MAKFEYDLSCFKSLRQQMFTYNYNMYPFFYSFNGVNTFVALYVITPEERQLIRRLKYVLFRLIFMNQNNLNNTIECYLNSQGITDYNRDAFINFFHIQQNHQGVNFMKELCHSLVNQCPSEIHPIKDPDLIKVERHSLCHILGYDPDHCFRKSIIRLNKTIKGKQKHRDPNTFQLALRLFPNAANMYKDDDTVTYAFTGNENESVEESVAIARFIANEQKRDRNQK